VDVTDGDTPKIRMPVRMLSVDTPEVTARWIRAGVAPIEAPLGELLLPKLETGTAGSLHFRQGRDASAFGKQNIAARLLRPNGTKPCDKSHDRGAGVGVG
jgi:hypothetical protein